ncbi:hypothetical protein [Klebsiella michiganensis]|uniref:hypothetical protein n=1 Tax=Klebsiella michiganensis TaxID=1134687 RepID=UPI001F447B0A|nr:hypothetical protein [Klebsiella michiganensis]MBW5937553.1 hypothetical protein [Klebsiella michiganensis]
MTKSTITRERLQELAAGQSGFNLRTATHEESQELARMALAVIGSEPVRNPVLAYADSYRDMAKQGIESVPIWSVITDLERNIAPLYIHAQQPVVPEGLNPETTDLVLRFASALADKLYKAEQKYGRSTDWMKDDWYDDCLQSLWEHIEKGDPRDVAAYCAFMWYHGWVTTDYDRNVQNACRAAILQAQSDDDGEPTDDERIMAIEGIHNCERCGDEGWVMGEMGITRCACGQAGNSPVIPDGSASMLRRWLAFGRGMQNVGSQLPHNLIAETESMLAAAPQELK